MRPNIFWLEHLRPHLLLLSGLLHPSGWIVSRVHIIDCLAGLSLRPLSRFLCKVLFMFVNIDQSFRRYSMVFYFIIVCFDQSRPSMNVYSIQFKQMMAPGLHGSFCVLFVCFGLFLFLHKSEHEHGRKLFVALK